MTTKGLLRSRARQDRRKESADGASLDHSPTECFDVNRYLARNPDVRRAGLDPWIHYVNHGNAEGRDFPLTADSLGHCLSTLRQASASQAAVAAFSEGSEWDAMDQGTSLSRRAKVESPTSYLCVDVLPVSDGVLLVEPNSDYTTGLPTSLNVCDGEYPVTTVGRTQELLGSELHLGIIRIPELARATRVDIRDELCLSHIRDQLPHPVRFHLELTEPEAIQVNALRARDQAFSLHVCLRSRPRYSSPIAGGALESLQLLGVRFREDPEINGSPEIWICSEGDSLPSAFLYPAGPRIVVLRIAGACYCEGAPRLCTQVTITHRKSENDLVDASRVQTYYARCSSSSGVEVVGRASLSEMILFLECS